MILIFGGAYQGKRDFAESLLQAGGGADPGRPDLSKDDTWQGKPDPSNDEAVMAISCPVVCDCGALEDPGKPDFAADILCGLEEFTWACCVEATEERIEAADYMRAHREQWRDMILVITDVSQGIVPIDARTRAFREMNGRLMLYLASEAEQVYRVFCGIGKRLK